MREVKWVFSFIKGKNIVLMMLAWLAGIVTVFLLTVEPMIISHIVDDILKPMFADSSVKSEDASGIITKLLISFLLLNKK